MIIMHTTSTVKDLSAKDTLNFLINCNDEMYQKSWPGVHIQKHQIKRGGNDHIGDVIYAFEHVGEFTIEVRMKITKYIPEKLLEFRVSMRRTGFLVPIFLIVETEDSPEGVHLSNKFLIGWNGFGKVFDSIIEMFFHKLRYAMEEHTKIEWPLIAASLKK
jgi:hypothetical protein